jgi:hypothetical protein
MKKQGIWCAEFFDNWDDASPSRLIIVTAGSEEEAVDQAAAQMGSAARVDFVRVRDSRRRTTI